MRLASQERAALRDELRSIGKRVFYSAEVGRMRRDSIRMSVFVGLMVIYTLPWLLGAKADDKKDTWMWCTASELPSHKGERVFYSDPFPFEEQPGEAKLKNRFYHFVIDRYGAKIAYPNCMKAESRTEAESKIDKGTKQFLDYFEYVLTGWTPDSEE